MKMKDLRGVILVLLLNEKRLTSVTDNKIYFILSVEVGTYE